MAAALASEGSTDQVERAAGLLARRGAPLESEAERARAFGFLARRGYDYDVAYEAIRRARAR